MKLTTENVDLEKVYTLLTNLDNCLSNHNELILEVLYPGNTLH